MTITRYVTIIVICFLFSFSAKADWVSFSGAENAFNIAEIHVNNDHAKLVLEIYIGNLEVFEEIIPEDMFPKTVSGRPSDAERLLNFSEKTFQFKTDGSENLVAEVMVVEPRMRRERPTPFAGSINPITGRPIPGPPEDKRVLYAELIYRFEGQPQELTIIPPLDDKGLNRAPIGFVTYHEGVLINDFKYLNPATLRLDWDDPWYSEYDQKSLKRWQQGSVLSYLYIEPFEVRHEILARVKDLEAWIDLGLRGNEFIEADENEPLKKRIGEFLLKQDKVLINGKQLRPILDRTSFVKYSMTGSQFLDRPERLSINTAMLGVIITYLTDGLPQEVTVEWDLFSEKVQKVPTSAVDPAGPFPSYVTPDDNVHTWKNYLKTYTIPTVEQVAVADSSSRLRLPIGSVLCLAAVLAIGWRVIKLKQKSKPILAHLGLIIILVIVSVILYPHLQVSITKPGSVASTVTDDEATTMLHSLLKNVYRSFDFREEEDVYDKLAISVSGDLLTDIYLQNRKSFAVKRAGGAQAKVKDIEILDVAVKSNADNSQAIDLHSKWTAMGTVGHWGHIHSRQNLYNALITIESIDGAWKITGLELLDEKRIDPSPQTRKPGKKKG